MLLLLLLLLNFHDEWSVEAFILSARMCNSVDLFLIALLLLQLGDGLDISNVVVAPYHSSSCSILLLLLLSLFSCVISGEGCEGVGATPELD